ncbi:MAG: hypothetical protein JW896_11865 [Deltaproteobacteria bacterium]|nr:hypothetical protein [Deltaproteobacteria bacterium]
MSKIAVESIYRMMMGLALTISIAVSAGAADETNIYDTVELKNGDILTGTVLDNTFTLTTPYSLVTLKKDQISAIKPYSQDQKEDLVELNVGGTLTGTIEELTLSFKKISGETISLDKGQCKKIILRSNE